MSRSEMFVVGGALLIILGDLLFGIILQEFYTGEATWAAAALAVFAFFVQRSSAGSMSFLGDVMLVAALVVGLLGVHFVVEEVIEVLRDPSELSDVVDMLARIVWVVGAALAGWGGWLMWRNRSAA